MPRFERMPGRVHDAVRHAWLFALLLPLAACTAIPEGRFGCESSWDCPAGWTCGSDLRCYAQPSVDGGARDAAPGTDAGTDAGFEVDAGPPTPQLIADLTAIDLSGAPGLQVPGGRCKTYVFCTVNQNCVYYDMSGTLGHLQSSESTYYDGVTAGPAQPVKFRMMVGADSTCGDPSVTVAAGEFVDLTFDAGQMQRVYLPAFDATEITFYIADDGSTYYDAALSILAQAAP